jgi:hypothetical protein
MKLQRVHLRIQDRIKEVERRILHTNLECDNISTCLEFVRSNVKGTCLAKALALYVILKKRVNCNSCYILVFKPRQRRDLYLHAVVIIMYADNIIVLDPSVSSPGDFPYRPMENFRSLEEFNKVIGDVICIFNEEEAYIRQSPGM